MLFYHRIMLANRDSLIAEMGSDGKCSVYLRRQRGPTILLADNRDSSSGRSGFRGSTGLPGEITPALQELGQPFINNVQRLLRACILIGKCSNSMTQISREWTRNEDL